jgi:hypothetical protein
MKCKYSDEGWGCAIIARSQAIIQKLGDTDARDRSQRKDDRA